VGTDLVEKQPNEAMLIDDTTPATSNRDWRIPFIRYISDGSGFQDKIENERLIRRSKTYILVDGKLMRKNASSEVLLKCISQDDCIKLLDEIHAGSCDNHATVDIWERNKELIHKSTDIGEHFTREVIQSIVFIFFTTRRKSASSD